MQLITDFLIADREKSIDGNRMHEQNITIPVYVYLLFFGSSHSKFFKRHTNELSMKS